MSQLTEMIVTIASGILLVALAAVLVSKNANTAGVIQASASGFGNSLGVAESPVTGATYSIDLSYPTTNGLMNPAS